MRQGILLSILILLSQTSISQDLPNLPPSIKWQKINSPHFQVIYPKGLEEQAQKTTNILEHIYSSGSKSLNVSPRSFPVILQNQYAVSNGFVDIAPYRSEFFLFEPQDYKDMGNDRWLEHLASHEYRHIVQFEKSITPFNKFIYFLTGEYGIGIAAAGAAPVWFFEGDAVGVETAMGNTGRGRLPSFSMAFKANLLEKGGFNYHKQYLKSFKEFVPNHYLTGYLMTTYLKNNHGADIMGKIVGRSFKRPFIPFSFSIAMKKETGKHLIETYNDMLAEQKSLYQNQLEQLQPLTYKPIPHIKNKNFTSYLYPSEINDNKILAIKSGFSDIPAFISIDKSGNEKTLFELGLWNDQGRLSVNDSSVVWTEQAFDTRWQRISYSVIKKYNYITQKSSTLTSETKYSSPSISKDGNRIIAIDQTASSLIGLHLLDAHSGELIKAFSNPSNEFYSMPCFDDTGLNVIVLKHIENGKQVVLKNIETESEKILHTVQSENIGHPLMSNNKLLYTSDKNGIDNIYAYDLTEQRTFQITNARYGAFNPSITKTGKILFNDYTVDGYEISYLDMDKENWTESPTLAAINFPSKMIESEGIENILYNYPDSTYQSSKYRKALKSIRPHTWLLNTTTKNIISAQVYSKDLLQTTSMILGTIYNYQEKIWRSNASISYQAIYPIIDISVSTGQRSSIIPDVNSEKQTVIWSENQYSLGIKVPIYLTNSKYFRNASVSAQANYNEVSDYMSPTQISMDLTDETLHALTYNLSFFRLLRRSKLDLNSKWGQTFDLNYKHTPIGGDLMGQLVSFESNLFFPGLVSHHSLHLKISAQHSDYKNYSFSSPISFTRGYDAILFRDFYNISFNYKFPVARMDWHLGPVINIQRIYSNVFYDYGQGKNSASPTENLKSVGVETHFNFNLLRLLPLFDIGIRYSFIPNTQEFIPQIIIGNITL